MVEVLLPVTLGGKQYDTVWDANTMREYERATGVGYWKTINALVAYWDDNGEALASVGIYQEGEPVEVTKRRNKIGAMLNEYISTESLVCLLWAAIHSYDQDDNIVHPIGVNTVGRFVNPLETQSIIILVIKGHASNAPTKRELGEASGGSDKKVVPMPEATPKQQRVNGGFSSNALPEDAYASVDEKPAV